MLLSKKETTLSYCQKQKETNGITRRFMLKSTYLIELYPFVLVFKGE